MYILVSNSLPLNSVSTEQWWQVARVQLVDRWLWDSSRKYNVLIVEGGPSHGCGL